MRKFFSVTVFSIFIVCLFYSAPLLAGTEKKTYCEANYKTHYKSIAACEQKEEQAMRWLATNPVQDDIYRDCKENAKKSLNLLKDCAIKETNKESMRAASPLNLRNSEVWYAPSLKRHFPSLIRACGKSRPIGNIAVMEKDITKFNFQTSMLYTNMTPLLNVKGSVRIAGIPLPFQVKKHKMKRRYNLYLEAFLFSPDGRVLNISSAGGAKTLSSRGGTASFSIDTGRGYNFEEGAKVLVVASGSPITSSYPGASCVLLGAKRLSF